jgi:hypothetical protein
VREFARHSDVTDRKISKCEEADPTTRCSQRAHGLGRVAVAEYIAELERFEFAAFVVRAGLVIGLPARPTVNDSQLVSRGDDRTTTVDARR